MAERVIWTSRSDMAEQVVLVAVDVTDPGLQARFPYRILRRSNFLPEHTLCELSAYQLDALRWALDKELKR